MSPISLAPGVPEKVRIAGSKLSQEGRLQKPEEWQVEPVEEQSPSEVHDTSKCASYDNTSLRSISLKVVRGKVYEKASLIVQKNFDYTKIIEIHEKMGFCYFRASLQAKSNEENVERIKYAIQSYHKAIDLVHSIDFPRKRIRINQNKAWIKFLNSWLGTDVFTKKSLLDEWFFLH